MIVSVGVEHQGALQSIQPGSNHGQEGVAQKSQRNQIPQKRSEENFLGLVRLQPCSTQWLHNYCGVILSEVYVDLYIS